MVTRIGRITYIPDPFIRHYAPRSAAAAPGWWVVAGKTCVAAYQPKGAANIAGSYTNLATPGTYDAINSGGATWDAVNGWTGNGAGQYLTTGITPGYGWSMLVKFTNGPDTGNHMLCGSESGPFYIASCWGGTVVLFCADTQAPIATSGVLGISVAATGNPVNLYRDGLFDKAAPKGAVPAFPVYLLAYNGNGLPAFYTTASIQAWAIYSDILAAGEHATQAAAMAAL